MKEAAGTVLYRRDTIGNLEVLLVHPSGNYNRGKPWSIPKGLPDPGESLESAARRETLEEAGMVVDGPLAPLGSIEYTKSRKRVHAFAGQSAGEPRCNSWEVDCAEYVSLARAREILHPDQQPFLDRLEAWLAEQQDSR